MKKLIYRKYRKIEHGNIFTHSLHSIIVMVLPHNLFYSLSRNEWAVKCLPLVWGIRLIPVLARTICFAKYLEFSLAPGVSWCLNGCHAILWASRFFQWLPRLPQRKGIFVPFYVSSPTIGLLVSALALKSESLQGGSELVELPFLCCLPIALSCHFHFREIHIK